jgi:hypothetical protein
MKIYQSEVFLTADSRDVRRAAVAVGRVAETVVDSVLAFGGRDRNKSGTDGPVDVRLSLRGDQTLNGALTFLQLSIRNETPVFRSVDLVVAPVRRQSQSCGFRSRSGSLHGTDGFVLTISHDTELARKLLPAITPSLHPLLSN